MNNRIAQVIAFCTGISGIAAHAAIWQNAPEVATALAIPELSVYDASGYLLLCSLLLAAVSAIVEMK